jgi:hypothetical protein
MIELNENNRKVFEEVSNELGIKLAHDTHYDALNYEYSVVIGREVHRVDFQPTEQGHYQITKLVESYPFWPRLFLLLRNVVPLFPQVANIQYQPLSTLPLSLSPQELGNEIKSVLTSAL